jgi:hypothetical protein
MTSLGATGVGPHLSRLDVLREVLVDPARIAEVHDLAVRLADELLPTLKLLVVNDAVVAGRRERVNVSCTVNDDNDANLSIVTTMTRTQGRAYEHSNAAENGTTRQNKEARANEL